MKSIKLLTIFLALIIAVGIVKAAITPPLADDPSLVLRLSFDHKPTLKQHYSWEADWEGWSVSANDGAGREAGISGTWATDGQYSVMLHVFGSKGPTSYDDPSITLYKTGLSDYVYQFTVDVNVMLYGGGEFGIIVNGQTKWSTTANYTGTVTITVDGVVNEIKFYAHVAPFSSEELVAYIDNLKITFKTADDSGNGNDGTIHGAKWTTGRYGYALQFDEVDDYVEVPYSPELSTANATYILWINPSTITGQDVFLSHGLRAQFDVYTDKFVIRLRNETDTAWKNYIYYTTVRTNTWYFIAVSVQANNFVKIYINGVKVIEQPWIGGLKDVTVGVVLGKYYNAPGYKYNGIIDEVRIYNRTLSPEEIKAMYEALRVKFYDESTGEKIAGNATLFNANYSISLQTDDVTKEAVLFHADVPEYGEYRLKVSSDGYYPRYLYVNLSNDKLEEVDTYLPQISKAVYVTFHVTDYTGMFYNNTKLILSKLINNQNKIINSAPLDLEHKVSTYLIPGDEYIVSLSNGSETRTFGYISVVAPDTINIIVQSLLQFPLQQYAAVSYNLTNENGTITLQYVTLKGHTSQATIEIYNSSGVLVYTATSNTPSGKFVYISNPNEEYTVHFKVYNDIEPLEFKITTSSRKFLSIQVNVQTIKNLPEWFRIIFFGGLCLFVALLFKRSHVPVGLMLSFSLAAVFTSMGILPLGQGLLWVLAVLVGLSFFVWWRERER